MTSLMYGGGDAISPVGGPKKIRRPTDIRPPVPQAPQGTFGPGNDLRATQINPTPSTRLTGAQGMTDSAVGGVQNFNRGNAVQNYTGQFNQQLGVKPVGQRAVNPNVQGGQVNTQVGYNPANTNVNTRNVNTQVGFQGVNPNVQARSVNTNIGMRSAPTSVGFQGVNPNVQAGSVNTQAGFRGVNPNVQARTANTQVQGRSLFGQGMPSRTDLAKRALSDFTEQSALDRNQGIRQIGQSAARFGRIGAGMTTNDLTGLEANLDRNRRAQETQLATNVAEGDIGDRFRDRDYMTDVDTQNVQRGMQDRDYQTGVDERNYGRATNERDSELGVQERNIGRGIDERDFMTGVGERNIGRQMSERDTSMGLGERNIGRERQDRDTALDLDYKNVYSSMQDRDYQTGVDTQNVGRQMSERDTAMGLGERNVGRDFDDRGFSTGLEERNLGRQSDERGFATGLGERNVGRATDERNFQTGLSERNTSRDYAMAQDQAGLDERNTGRDFDARRSALEAAMGMGNAEQGDAMDRFNTASGYERGIYGQEAADRDELRGERGYQEDLARFSNEQQIRQREMEEQFRNNEFNRAAVRSGIGMRGAQQKQGQTEGAYDLLADWMRRRQAGGSPTTAGIGSRLPTTPTYTPQAVPRPRVTVKGRRGF